MRLAALLVAFGILPFGLQSAPQLVVTPPTGNVGLKWSYDTNLLSTNLFFNVYETTNVMTPLAQWNTLTNVVGTSTCARVSVVPGEHFFVVSASNFWGETSITSPPGYTPPLPIQVNQSLTIQKLP